MWPGIRFAFAAHGVADVRVTAGPTDERNLARGAIAGGATTIVVVGGDGTSSNVADVILRSGANVRLGVVPAGTGNDFAKILGTAGQSLGIVASLSVEPSDTRVDVGCIEDKHFLNSCGLGFDVAVLQGLDRTRWLTGSAVYLYAALTQVLGFRGLHLAIESPRRKRARTLYMMVVIANCPYFGGAFTIAPSADVSDGELDAVSFVDAAATRRLRLLSAATRGRHVGLPGVEVERASEFILHCDEIPFFETDGEVHRANSASVSVRCLPLALRVITGGGFGTR